MDYPTQLKLNPEIEQSLITYLDTELMNHLGERGDWIEEINSYQRDYIARPSEGESTFPFVGSSNFIVPLTAIAYEAIEARTIQKLHALKQKISATIKDPEVEKIQDEYERYLDDEIMVQGMGIECLTPAVQETILLGTGVGQATYEKVVRKGKRNGKPFEVVVRQGNVLKSTPITNFLMPFDCIDPQTARWCGEVFWLTPLQVQEAETSKMFVEGTTKKLASYYYPPTTATTDVRETLAFNEELDKREPNWPQQLNFFMIYLSYQIEAPSKELKERSLALNLPCDDDEEFFEIVAIYHKDSRNLVSCTYNTFEDLRRPYRAANFFSKPYRWTGVGIGEQNRSFQEEVSTQHRQIIDSGTIANTRMWKVRKGNNSIRDNEPIFPNKIWWVDEMDDVEAMKNEEIYASAFNMENQATIYSQQRTGINEITLGMPGVGTPGTATDSSLRVQESQRKGDYTYGNTKRWISQLIHDSQLNIVQYGPNIERLRYSPMGSEIEMFLKRPYNDFMYKYIVEVGLVDQNDNAMLDRQTMTQLSGTAQQYYNSLFPVLQQLVDPSKLPPVVYEGIRTMISGANEIFTKILETYGIRKTERYLFKVPPPQPIQPPQNEQATDPFAGLNSGGPSQSPLALPNNTSNVVNISTPDIQSTLPSGLAGLLGSG